MILNVVAGIADGVGQALLAKRAVSAQQQAHQSALAQHQQSYAGAMQNSLAQLHALASGNPYANAYMPPPETLESWFERLERRVNSLLDAGEFMGELEHQRWRKELDDWWAKEA